MLRFELDPPVDQTVRLITDEPGTSSFWDAWGPSLITGGVSLLVALIALGGVLLSASKSRTAMIDAENLRATKALDAEGVRHSNTIEAENVRAAKAIAAEDRRHANALRQEEIAWMRGAKAKAYFGLVEALNRLTEATASMLWFARPYSDDPASDDAKRHSHPEGVKTAVDDWNDAYGDVAHRIAEVETIANIEIARKARSIVKTSSSVNKMLFAAWGKHPETPYIHAEVAKSERAKMRKLTSETFAAIRAEMNAAKPASHPGTPLPVPEGASTGTEAG